MSNTLLAAGLACLIAAIVGGGLKAFGIEVPVIASRKRQVLLGCFGFLLLCGLLATRQPESPVAEKPSSTALPAPPPKNSFSTELSLGPFETKAPPPPPRKDVSLVTVFHPYDLQGAKFQVDGQPAVIIRGDLRSTTLELPPGNHRLTAVNSDDRCEAVFRTPDSHAVPLKCSPSPVEKR